MTYKHFVDNISKRAKDILLHTVEYFQVLLCITNSLIKHQLFVYAQLNYQQFYFKQFSLA